MDIYMIWAHEAGSVWLVDSWDDDSIAGNGFGWEEAKDKAYELHGAENIRVIKAAIDIDAVFSAFDPPKATFGAVSVEANA